MFLFSLSNVIILFSPKYKLFRQEHEEEMQQLRRLKEQEVAAATSAHAHTKSLQSLMQQVLNSTKEVSDMRHQVEVTHRGGLEEREMAARARDEYLKQLQERSLRQQAENDEERARLQGQLCIWCAALQLGQDVMYAQQSSLAINSISIYNTSE